MTMVSRRIIAGFGVAAALAVGCAVAPAIGAEDVRPLALNRMHSTSGFGIGSFTPASADPRLAAVMARGGLDTSGFHFTPSTADRIGRRPVTVAVRARTSVAAVSTDIATQTPSPVALAPIAYNLGAAVGWKRFALTGDLARADLAGTSRSAQGADLGLSYPAKRASSSVKAVAPRSLGNQPRAIAETPNELLDVGGAFSLSRNLDVTAGVRYKAERERLPLLTDSRRDSQSVYVGTAFRF